MKRPDNDLFLKDIFDFCIHIQEYVEDVEKSDLLNNRMLQDALVRKIELIGEAVKNLTPNFVNKIRKSRGAILRECVIR